MVGNSVFIGRAGPAPVVLVVEDELLLLGMVEETIAEAGFSVIPCGTGEEAVKQLQDVSPAVLVTDINLGRQRMNGWDVARIARLKDPALPVIYVTGDSAHEWQAKAVPGGVLIAKPFAPEQLAESIIDLVRKAPVASYPAALGTSGHASR